MGSHAFVIEHIKICWLSLSKSSVADSGGRACGIRQRTLPSLGDHRFVLISRSPTIPIRNQGARHTV